VTVTIVNLILTTVIFIVGIWAFFKRRSDVALSNLGSSKATPTGRAVAIPEVSLYIGIAFGLFAVSHALTLAGLATTLQTFIIIIRVIGYLLVLVAPCRVLMKK